MRVEKALWGLAVCFLALHLLGCEAFTRKFTRKSKKTDAATEMVLIPEQYRGPDLTQEEIYRQHYLYWSGWQEELINALAVKASSKKKLDCAQQAMKNLMNMQAMLVADAQKNFDPEITKFNDLIADLNSDAYGTNDRRNLRIAERIKSNIHKNFIYPKIKNYLK